MHIEPKPAAGERAASSKIAWIAVDIALAGVVALDATVLYRGWPVYVAFLGTFAALRIATHVRASQTTTSWTQLSQTLAIIAAAYVTLVAGAVISHPPYATLEVTQVRAVLTDQPRDVQPPSPVTPVTDHRQQR
jgi:hypothetical protein